MTTTDEDSGPTISAHPAALLPRTPPHRTARLTDADRNLAARVYGLLGTWLGLRSGRSCELTAGSALDWTATLHTSFKVAVRASGSTPVAALAEALQKLDPIAWERSGVGAEPAELRILP